ncbi:MAG: YbhN family protein [Paracoccaceae bacterium]
MAGIAANQKPVRLRVTRTWLFRVAGSVLILGFTLWWLPTGEVLAGFRALDARVFAAAFGLFLIGHLVSAAKWWLLIDRGVSFRRALRAHFAGLAANLFLPGVSGGDAVRAGVLLRTVRRSDRLIAGSLVDRLIDIVALAIVSGGGLLALRGGGGGTGFVLLVQVAALLAAILFCVFIVFPRAVPAIARRLPRLPLIGLALKLAEAFGWLAGNPLRLLAALSMSVAVQAGFVPLALWIAGTIGALAPAAAWFFAWPLAKILAVLPISAGGLGVREASLATILAQFGAVPASIVAASLIWQAVLFCAGLLGAVSWLVFQEPSNALENGKTPVAETEGGNS